MSLPQRIWRRITEYYSTTGNWLGRASTTARIHTQRWTTHLFRNPSTDWGRADYEWWTRAYYCRVRGLELSGLFIKPLVSKISGWVMAKPPNWKVENEATAAALESWWADNHTTVLRAYRQSLKQGDEFIIVNPDLSLTMMAPNLVEPIVADDDYGRVIGWRITQTLQHPQETNRRMTVIDEYYADRRVHQVEVNGITMGAQEYPNLLGRIPVVHIANMPEDGQTFGHPEAEALVEVLQRYNTTFVAALEGNELQGRPTPVLSFENQQDLEAFWALYGETETQTLPDGTTETQNTLSVDLTQLLTVSAAQFKYEAPGSFAGDTEKLLGLMFYLILEHTEIPEFVFGNAIASSQASAQAQMPVWIKFIESRQGEASQWLLELAEIVIGYLALMQPGVAAEKPSLQWDPIDDGDGNLTLATLQWLYTEGLIDERTAVMLAPVDVSDIDAVLEAARAERAMQTPSEGSPFGEDAVDSQLADEINRMELEI